MAVVSFDSLAIAVPNKYYVLNTWCVTPCGELHITLRHLPSVCDQRDLVRGGTFCVDCPRVHAFCLGPDQSGRIGAEGWVEAPHILRPGGKLVPMGRSWDCN